MFQPNLPTLSNLWSNALPTPVPTPVFHPPYTPRECAAPLGGDARPLQISTYLRNIGAILFQVVWIAQEFGGDLAWEDTCYETVICEMELIASAEAIEVHDLLRVMPESW